MDSKVEDFFKEIEALTVPDELIEKAYTNTAPPKAAASTKKEPPVSESENGKASITKKETACPWQEIHDDSTGYSYYWNVNTNEVTWDCPEEYALYLKSTYIAETTAATQETKKKANPPSPNQPVGAIIPISYYGNTSSSDESSDIEKDIQPPKKTDKRVKPTNTKKSKSTKKQKSNGQEPSLIGPQLPPDFQFPVAVQSLRPVVDYDSFTDEDEEPESPKPPSSVKTTAEDIKIVPAPKAEVAETRPPLFPIVSTEPNSEIPSFKENSQPKFEMLSFKTKSEPQSEESSLKIKFEPNSEALSSDLNSEPKPEEPSLKRKSEVLSLKKEEGTKEMSSKSESFKKLKKSDVNIDKIFAAHSAYGKHGFGFGWQIHPENDEVLDENKRVPRTKRGQFGKSPISFVKSCDVLDLNVLNQASSEGEKGEETSDLKGDSSPHVTDDVKDEPEPDLKELDLPIALQESEPGSPEENKVSPEVELKEEADDFTLSSIDVKTDDHKEEETVPSVEFALEDVEEDIDEIDRVLSEALEAKKAAKSLEKPSTQDLKNDNLSVKPLAKSPESDKESESPDDDEEEEKEALAEQSSEVIEKLNFLLASNSSLSSLSAFLVQVQTRIVDWQAKALDSNYFKSRLKEVQDYLQSYEASVILETGSASGTGGSKLGVCANKRYFYLNKTTKAAQWTYPEESSHSEASSPPDSPRKELPTLATPEPLSFSSYTKDVSSPPPPPPGVDSPPPLPPDEPSPPLPDREPPVDMDLENSNDEAPLLMGRNGQNMETEVKDSVFQNSSSPVTQFCDVKGSLTKTSIVENSEVCDGSLNPKSSAVSKETGKAGDLDTSRSKTTKPSTSTKKEKKKKKLQLGIGLKKKNIPSLVEKWLKIKEEQDKEDKDSEVLRKELL